DLDAGVEVGGDAPDDRQLLPVLLAEGCTVRPDRVEQLRDDGGDAAEMSGSRPAAQRLGEPRHLHAGGEPLRVHGARRRRIDHVDAGRGAQGGVVVEGARGRAWWRGGRGRAATPAGGWT